MVVAYIATGFIQEKCYIYYDEASLEGVIIDPGDDADQILRLIKEKNIHVQAILLTHGHFDHIGACQKIKEFCNAPVCIGKNEIPLVVDAQLNGSTAIGGHPIAIHPDKSFNDGDIFEFGEHCLQVIFTPGHTFGSVCYYDAAESVLFSGDTLFFESVGRTDLPTGDHNAQQDSILNKLFTLPSEVKVYPGHMKETKIGHEKKYNPYVRLT